MVGSGKLYIVTTPIGNLEDISQRALNILSTVDVLASEDTRITRKIYEKFQLNSPRKIITYNLNNEERSADGIINLLDLGLKVALCSSAGSPGLSDPGYPLIRKCCEKDIPVEVVPGASALLIALVASGIPTSSFIFKGFPPKKEGKRKVFIAEDQSTKHTLIFYESPFRIIKFLRDALEVLGDRECAVCFELTKKYEEIKRGYLSEVIKQLEEKENIKGEITIVIAGNHPKFFNK
ncbi:MAG: 16S rRNA (cytidine(1402)-2'-O)-methyltransferase [Spirochaetes bacterium]|nr:16S rRNA (cytidine(1402)-2'-O)-methyltransferase [Spirochaetota bacterium]